MAKLHQKSSHLMSVKLGMVGALVGWGGGAEGGLGLLTDSVTVAFFCVPIAENSGKNAWRHHDSRA